MTTLSHKSGPTQPNHYSYHSEHTAQFIIQLVYAALSRDCCSYTRVEPGLASPEAHLSEPRARGTPVSTNPGVPCLVLRRAGEGSHVCVNVRMFVPVYVCCHSLS